MDKEEKSLDIEMLEINDEDCLKFCFSGKLTKEDAVEGISYWEDIFDSIPEGEKTKIIWDCKEMTGFENSARVEWQHAVKKLKTKIDVIWLIANSKVIKAGAKVMSMFSSFKIKNVDNEDELIANWN